jgi:predicted DNA-binding transcriptional regulator AlpA
MKPDRDCYLNATDIAEYLGVHRVTFYRWRRDHKFPPPDGRTPYGDPRWKRSTVDEVMRDLAADYAFQRPYIG